MTSHEAALFVAHLVNAADPMTRENKANRVGRRSRNFLVKLARDCGRPQIDQDDSALSLAILDAAARAGLERPSFSEPPEWARRAAEILRDMQVKVPHETIPRRFTIRAMMEKLHPGSEPPFEKSDPSAYICQIAAQEFFFGFGMLEAEEHLAICLLAYAEGWLPSKEWADLQEDPEMMALLDDIHTSLRDLEAKDVQIAHLASEHARLWGGSMQPAGIGLIFIAIVFGGAGSFGLLAVLLGVLGMALWVSGHARKMKSLALMRTADHFTKAKYTTMRSGTWPRILPPSTPAPPPPPHIPWCPDCGTRLSRSITADRMMLECSGCPYVRKTILR